MSCDFRSGLLGPGTVIEMAKRDIGTFNGEGERRGTSNAA
jgi:hypothetical protein